MINKTDDTQSIDVLDLSVRAHNVLWRGNVRTIHDLKQLSYDDLLHMRNMGKRCAKEICVAMLAYDDTQLSGGQDNASPSSRSASGQASASITVGADKGIQLAVSDIDTDQLCLTLSHIGKTAGCDPLRLDIDLITGQVKLYNADNSLNACLQTDFRK